LWTKRLETQRSGPNLLVVLISLVVNDVEELELVDTARGGNDTEPVTELLLLEEFLGPVASNQLANDIQPAFNSRCQDVQVLEVAARQLVVGSDLDLALALLLNNDIVAKVVGAALDLDGVLEELLESRDVEDLVASRLLGVDDELGEIVSIQLPYKELKGNRYGQLTFLVCFWALPDFFCKTN
jgi:hypothetical protein